MTQCLRLYIYTSILAVVHRGEGHYCFQIKKKGQKYPQSYDTSQICWFTSMGTEWRKLTEIYNIITEI